MTEATVWQRAASFAASHHRGQQRKDQRTPYFAHPARVALTLCLEFGCRDETVIAAALLHDVLEDTTADYEDLVDEFGPEVARLVACLSKDSRLPAEFDVTPFLRAGPNLLAVAVVRWSDATYIEDQDHWFMAGLHREVYLYATGREYIADLSIRSRRRIRPPRR